MDKFVGMGLIAFGFIALAPMNLAVGMIVALLGLIVTWRSEKSVGKSVERSPQPTEYRIPCPYCAEMIKPMAVVCRFCGAELPEE